MSTGAPGPQQAAAGGGPQRPGGDKETKGEAPQQPGADVPDAEDKEEEPNRPQDAWSARRDLVDHSPKAMGVGANARFGGSLVAGDQHGVSGGLVAGDVIMGSKTEVHFGFGISTASHGSGEVPQATLNRLAPYFVTDETVFEGLVERLHAERVIVLSGPHFTGRRTAALMLLQRLEVSPVRILVRDTTPAQLVQQLGNDQHPARGYVLCDLTTRRDQPLREPHLLAARDQLIKDDAYLVITVGPTSALEEDISAVEWVPPSSDAVLAAHLRELTDETTAQRLLTHPSVAEFIGRDHQLREVAAFAKQLKRYTDGEADESTVRNFSLFSLESQVQEWFEEDDERVPLRDKAFLVALAAFDGGSYALTAELSDLLYALLQATENSALRPQVPVFGTHIGKRLQLARARLDNEEENTEWGPVVQAKATFRDERVSLVLLREVWTGHPSARPALVGWLQQLADDGRPLVRTRAASTVAVLAYADLPSTMALVIEVWATSHLFRHRLVAVNALTLAHLLEAPNIPRILDAWCEGDDEGMRWVAIRAYGLIGAERPKQTLAALRGAIRKAYKEAEEEDGDEDDIDELMLEQLAWSVELLLLSPARDEVLTELLKQVDVDRPAHILALGGFLSACERTKDDERYGRPLLLDWYADAVRNGDQAADGIARLWRAALDDRRHTRDALDALSEWVRTADRDPSTEWALASLLRVLVTTPAEYQRLSHLLRTLRGEDGALPPPVAARLLTVLPDPAEVRGPSTATVWTGQGEKDHG
ncbi:hypothetical protein [Streptomyces sp. NBC_00620]|uniref:hypothetical protein n=1 Tax=Streptomyces sp. NBC_00620 TaxID=2903666 RepID=UPI002253ABCD|nr:hypothetical protein [Streptomyces sp. NBC_00620]MCX4972146.1 hypothetical protein [Streptomyces sp. NBC_00620]